MLTGFESGEGVFARLLVSDGRAGTFTVLTSCLGTGVACVGVWEVKWADSCLD